MDELRWILLGIGIVLVTGIYLWDRFKRQSRKRADRFFDDDETAEFNMAPQPSDDGDYDEALAGLNHVLHENRHADDNHDEVLEDSVTAATATTTFVGRQGHQAADEALAEAEIGVRDNSDDAPESTERLIVFYLKAPAGQAFAGTGLFEALSTAGLSLGDMGIYHDRNSQGHSIFCVANIFEPGTLDIDDPEQFSTRGVALFMQLPLTSKSIDEQDAFERMLGKAEILAGRLGGELHDEHHQPLDDDGVARARALIHTS